MLTQIQDIIRSAGQQMRSADKIQSETKTSYRDIVTLYDVQIQDYLKEQLLKLAPKADFIGEESKDNKSSSEQCFIVDPIDGTANFRYGLCKSACSIAYAEHGEVLLGCIYDPYLDELFYAEKGKGSYCNGKPLRSLQGRLDQGITIFGTNPYHADTTEQTFALAKLCYKNTMDLRHFGAASVDFCYVAAGRAILFFEGGLSPWDFAAGRLIAAEQGLLCKTWEGKELNLFTRNSVVCGNAEAVAQWFELLEQTNQGAE